MCVAASTRRGVSAAVMKTQRACISAGIVSTIRVPQAIAALTTSGIIRMPMGGSARRGHAPGTGTAGESSAPWPKRTKSAGPP